MSNTASETVAHAVGSVPHAAAAGMVMFGVSLQDWYVVLASLFVVLQLAYFMWAKFIPFIKEKIRGRDK